jgi:hypothetical protein
LPAPYLPREFSGGVKTVCGERANRPGISLYFFVFLYIFLLFARRLLILCDLLSFIQGL